MVVKVGGGGWSLEMLSVQIFEVKCQLVIFRLR